MNGENLNFENEDNQINNNELYQFSNNIQEEYLNDGEEEGEQEGFEEEMEEFNDDKNNDNNLQNINIYNSR